jgi:hypothetical protein
MARLVSGAGRARPRHAGAMDFDILIILLLAVAIPVAIEMVAVHWAFPALVWLLQPRRRPHPGSPAPTAPVYGARPTTGHALPSHHRS